MPIYFDYAATTPMDNRVAAAMAKCLTLDGAFGNPASTTHEFGWQASELVATARKQVADLLNADSKEVVFTSGATESDNLAIKGVAFAYKARGRHIITSKTEHKAVLDTCEFLANHGFNITYLTPDSDGLISTSDLENAICKDTILVSIMHVNNETGVVQDIKSLGNICREHKVLFHVDAAQSAGKLAIDVKTMPVDLLSVSAHKIYGPKGIGALYIRRKPKIKLQAQIHGGGHEFGFRSGTLATHQIVGMGAAFDIAKQRLKTENTQILALKNKLIVGINKIPGTAINGNLQHSVAGILNVSFKGIDSEALIMALHEFAVSTGSACTSATVEPSYVLKALGLTDVEAHSAIRFSIGRYTAKEDVNKLITCLTQEVNKLRQLSPLELEL